MKKSNSFNITYLIIFIIFFFTAIFPFVETLKDKSNKKRLLKREVNAISGLIEKKCLKKKYNSECTKIILANYIESRERLFGDIDNYIDLSKIIIIENEFPKILELMKIIVLKKTILCLFISITKSWE